MHLNHHGVQNGIIIIIMELPFSFKESRPSARKLVFFIRLQLQTKHVNCLGIFSSWLPYSALSKATFLTAHINSNGSKRYYTFQREK
jgi:hypothetical protein